mmetsp:Transcript_27722/g.5078  ORF Transcript_27722/g.5078 Transcript_27722/m.5078 type:complete len:117 (+) Transcript_27722:434-784(+)
MEISVDNWEEWNSFRVMLGPSSAVGVNLVINKQAPDEDICERWLGEPIAHVVLYSQAFLINQNGYPVLSKSNQVFVKGLLRRKAAVIIGKSVNLEQHRAYMCFLFRNMQPLSYKER